MIKYVTDRLKERSTWLGLVGLLTAIGVSIDPALHEAIITLGLGIAGIVAVLTKDKPTV